jgi:thiol-disulfide isomerase/thioredoxin
MVLRFAPAFALTFAGLAVADSPKSSDADVKLTVVKWPELEKAIASHKGKVVVIDMWADYCIPCKKEFPHFVELHQKYGKDGLVCISLTVDDVDDKDRSLKFLKAQKATMINYLIEEPAETWQKKLDATVPPNVFVIGKDGQRVKRFTSAEPFTYADVEKVVKPLLGK